MALDISINAHIDGGSRIRINVFKDVACLEFDAEGQYPSVALFLRDPALLTQIRDAIDAHLVLRAPVKETVDA